ncbi:response regulator transcription factor [Natronomonas salsuginis]|uniref:Response regulator n=1 Tax=Natronomonas salsuginis TaxID=2217661 RepID=A0A4U5JH94_9EURY|nr:response regulator [Natronomonas salsuginis]TKR27836.1 response regulator [Natronomonas salsuginis]
MGGEPTVVIAEDQPDLRKLLVYTLESEGYTVEAFGAGDDCLKHLQAEPVPALVILDIMMPGMDGVDVLERIREDDRLADIPVVLLSGRGRESDVVAEFEADADDYITKPFSPSELRARVARLL